MSLVETESKDQVQETRVPVILTDEPKPELDSESEVQKSDSIFNRIRRSVSISAVSLANQRKSTFYLSGDIDVGENGKAKESTKKKSVSNNSPSPIHVKSRVVRPKIPPPPIPAKNVGGAKAKNVQQQRKSLYSEAGVFNKNSHQNKPDDNRTSWYAEIGLYPKPPTDAPSAENIETIASFHIPRNSSEVNECSNINPQPVFSSLLDELNSKVINSNVGTETETPYYNQSLDSFNSTDSGAVHDLAFLEDEPLYQFYDPTSISDYDNSDFENEIYEDVDERNEIYISSTPTPELMSVSRSDFNFTRSLWCETPEVTKSAVLSKLSPQQKKLQEAKFELITSEASYLNSLNVLCNHFVSRFANSNIVNERDMNELFGKVKEVKACSQKIMRDLEKCWQRNILLNGICDIIQSHAAEDFRVYIPYCENQVTLNDTLNRMRENPAFKELLKELESSTTCQFLTLYSFLMLPMQRITRWPLLLDAILKRLSETDPEYLTCQFALASLNEIVGQCNDAARKKEQEIELKRISHSLDFAKALPAIDIQKPERWLIKSGQVTSFQPRNGDTQMTLGKRFNKVPLHLFLFNDLFIVTKKKSDESYSVIHYCPRNMIELRRVDTFPTILKKEAQDKKNNFIYLSILENQEGKIIELLLSSSTESDKERWIEAFSPPQSENPDETVYECWDCPQMKALHNYNACQPDELSLSKGDVINVLRKMNDGWYHGERLRDGQMGWFPANYTTEIINPHVRARNLRQRYRLLTFSENYLNSS
ncbi:ephexin isoform X2 [Leptinotarsa decemlineata]